MRRLCYFLFQALSSHDGSCTHEQPSFDSGSNQVTSVFIDALNRAVPCTCSFKIEVPRLVFQHFETHYINKGSLYFGRYKKTKTDPHYGAISYFIKLLKIAVIFYRQVLLKSVDDRIKHSA